jgi:hypothetical protein
MTRENLHHANKDDTYRILSLGIRADSKSKEHAEILAEGIKWVGFQQAMDLTSIFKNLPTESRLIKALLSLHGSGDQDNRVEVTMGPKQGKHVLSLRMQTLWGTTQLAFRDIVELRPDWEVIRIINELVSCPSQASLSATLKGLADLAERNDVVNGEVKAQLHHLPWLLGMFIGGDLNAFALRDAASQVANGQFGGPEDWAKAEQRWKSEGITEVDVLASAQPRNNANISVCGAPPFRAYSVTVGPEAGQLAEYLMSLSLQMVDGVQKDDILHAASFCLSATREVGKRQIVSMLRHLLGAGRHIWASCLPSISRKCWQEDATIELVNEIGIKEKWFREENLSRIHSILVRSALNRPKLHGLLVLLAMTKQSSEPEDKLLETVGMLEGINVPANVVLAHAVLCTRNGLFDMVNAKQVAAADLPLRAKMNWLGAIAGNIANQMSEEPAKRLALELIGAGAYHRSLYRGLSVLSDLRRTEFHVESVWNGLALPKTYFSFTIPAS